MAATASYASVDIRGTGTWDKMARINGTSGTFLIRDKWLDFWDRKGERKAAQAAWPEHRLATPAEVSLLKTLPGEAVPKHTARISLVRLEVRELLP